MYDSTDVWADDVRSIIQVLQLDHPVLCGWSYGTRIIGDYLQKYGEEEIRGFHFVASVPGKDVVGETWTKIHSKMMSEDAEEIIQANTMLLDAMIHEPMQPEEYFLFQGFQSLVPPHVRKAILSRKPLENPELVKITKILLLLLTVWRINCLFLKPLNWEKNDILMPNYHYSLKLVTHLFGKIQRDLIKRYETCCVHYNLGSGRWKNCEFCICRRTGAFSRCNKKFFPVR